MKKSFKRNPTIAVLSGLGTIGLFVTHALFAGTPQAGGSNPASGMEPVPALTPYVEAHTHFDDKDPEGSVRSALAALERQNAARIFFLALPETFDRLDVSDEEVLLPFVKKYPGKVAVLGGGGSLNPMIMKAVATGDAG